MIPELFKSVTGSVVRFLLNGLFVWLVAKGVITADQSNGILVWLIGAVAVLAWSLIQKLRAHVKLDTALGLPAGSTIEEVNKRI
ncbi:MAG TPA: hypothetical protein PLD20_05810 [Blastocatellia bacterium]|nr:hypothetical protein [Blastocatellia bacterium]HMV87610.1 hypothetical protein [Blastocatellia bacterium]HMX24716.1 hypothetical protein [Blastocatellia bacterium]HMY74912.1 hypothetical protein [Blastocatellia bacterium]HMZ17423.1 hypothetical protein [Blastocatellia bacterium]